MNTAFRIKFGDAFWRHVLRPYLFGKEAEDAHLFTIRALQRIQEAHLLWLLRLLYRSPNSWQPLRVFGVSWRNMVGLAAGFDKQAEVIPALEALGFGSAEIGTVTPRPQPGNDRPRLFRYPSIGAIINRPSIGAIINRYGFNSVGSRAVADRLGQRPPSERFPLPIGVSIGKNKDTPDEKAVGDYLAAFADILPVLRPGSDWVKINISSPNTPGLRAIFSDLDAFLGELVERARELALDIGSPLPPLVLKVPPDNLTPNQLSQVVTIAAKHGFAGIEATNTTTDEGIKRRWGLTEAGGVSGEPLRELATQRLREMRDAAQEHHINLVGVGGISQGEHALEKREAGAKAVQVYTGLVFRGPTLIHEVLNAWRHAP